MAHDANRNAMDAGAGRAEVSSADVADGVLSEWTAIAAALTPIIGRRGVAALYARSLQLTIVAFPWLHEAADRVPGSMDLEALHAALVRQRSADAAAAGHDQIAAFRHLLAGLVGAPLCERLLRPPLPRSGDAAPDPTT